MYFLRYTNTATEDLERGTSINSSDFSASEISRERVAEMFGCDAEEVQEINGTWCQVLDGLCGYQLEADNLEDAIEESQSNPRQFAFVGQAVIFKGVAAKTAHFVADGDLFHPQQIVAKIS